jgi:aspartyl protease family protein
MNHDNQVIYYIVLIVVLLASIFGRSRKEISSQLKMLLVWVGIIAVVSAIVIYWGDVKNTKFYAAIVPGESIKGEDGSMYFIRASDGHFYINSQVNDKEIRFMVDTGASDIALTTEDAETLGFEKDKLHFNKIYNTANGTTRGASIKLDSIKVGEVTFHNVSASVNEGKLDTSLLGMSLLDRFRSYKIEGDKLIIYF